MPFPRQQQEACTSASLLTLSQKQSLNLKLSSPPRFNENGELLLPERFTKNGRRKAIPFPLKVRAYNVEITKVESCPHVLFVLITVNESPVQHEVCVHYHMASRRQIVCYYQTKGVRRRSPPRSFQVSAVCFLHPKTSSLGL